MNICALSPAVVSPKNAPPQPPAPPPEGPQDTFLQKAAGTLRGTTDALIWSLPGLYAGREVARGETDGRCGNALRKAAGIQGLVVGGTLGLCLGGLGTAAAGAIGGGLLGLFQADFGIKDDSCGRISDRVLKSLEQHPDPTTPRERAAQTVRAALVGSRAAREEGFQTGYDIGAGKIEGLTKGLKSIPEVWSRDNSQTLPPQPERSWLKKLVGLPLAIAGTAGTTLAGGLAGMGRDITLGGALWGSLLLGAVGSLAAVFLAPPMVMGAMAGLTGLALTGSVVVGASQLTQGEDSIAERFSTRKNHAQQFSPAYEPYAEPSRKNVAARHEARLQGLVAGLKNGAIEGFQGGSRLTDPILDGVEELAEKIASKLKNLPEKMKGVADAFKDPE